MLFRSLKIAAVEGQYNGRAIFVNELTDDLHVNNCELSGAYSFVLINAGTTNHSLYFEDTKFNSVIDIDDATKSVNFLSCIFNSTLRLEGAQQPSESKQTAEKPGVVLVNCEFTENAILDVSRLGVNQVIVLRNCTIGGQVIPEAVIVCGENGVAYVDGNNVPLVVDQDSEKVVFTGTQTN